jgi:hypothetical protein
VSDIQLVGTLAYLAAEASGLWIVDVADPAHPIVRGRFSEVTRTNAVTVVNNRAYLADVANGVQIVDVSDPTAPLLLGSAPWGNAKDVDVEGSLAYIAAYADGLIIYDVSDPAHPIWRSSFDNNHLLTGTEGVEVVGTLAYVADDERGMRIVDVSNPDAPTLKGATTMFHAQSVHVHDTTAYVVGYGLHTFDISDPTQPMESGSTPLYYTADDVAVAGSVAYVADWNGGLLTVDLSTPSAPAVLGDYGAARLPRLVAATDTLAFVASEPDGLVILDVSDPSHPIERGAYHDTRITDMQLVDNLIYLVDFYDGFSIVDVADPTHPQLRVHLPSVNSLTHILVVDQLAFVTEAQAGIQIFDVQNPAAPQPIGHFGQPGDQVVQVTGTRVAVHTGNSLAIYDITDRAHPTLIDGPRLLSSIVTDVQLVGNLAYVVDPTSGLVITDITNSMQNVVGHYGTLGEATAVLVDGGVTYLTEDRQGLYVLDTRDPSRPTLLGRYASPRYGFQVTRHGNTIYLVDRYAGVQILQMRPALFPVSAPIAPTGGHLATLDDSVVLDIPDGAVSTSGTITVTGQVTPTHPLDGQASLLRSFTLEARTVDGQTLAQFAIPYTLTLRYTDAELAASGIAETSLAVHAWNGSSWAPILPCAGCVIDTTSNRIVVRLAAATEFAVTGRREHAIFLPVIAQ